MKSLYSSCTTVFFDRVLLDQHIQCQINAYWYFQRAQQRRKHVAYSKFQRPPLTMSIPFSGDGWYPVRVSSKAEWSGWKLQGKLVQSLQSLFVEKVMKASDELCSQFWYFLKQACIPFSMFGCPGAHIMHWMPIWKDIIVEISRFTLFIVAMHCQCEPIPPAKIWGANLRGKERHGYFLSKCEVIYIWYISII